MALWRKNKRKESFAGLAVMTGGIYYLELLRSDGDLSVKRYEFVSYGRTTVRQDSMIDQEEAVRTIGELAERIGGFGEIPVSIGIPSRDVMIKNVDFPDMDVSMAKEALHWEFDKKFPFAISEALYDADVIDLPDGDVHDRIHLVVGAIKRGKIEVFLEKLRELKVPMSSLEPNNIAVFRAVSRGISVSDYGYIVLVVTSESLQVMIGYRESSLLFRSVPFPSDSIMSVEELANRIVSEIQATGNYVRTLFRGLELKMILLGGDVSVREPIVTRLKDEFDFAVEVADPWSKWDISGVPEEYGESDAVVGLATRNLS